MKSQYTILVILVLIVASSEATAIDRVKRKDKGTVFGEITSMNNKEVTVSDRSTKTTIPVGRIKAIFYEDEPQELGRARADVAQGRYEDALRELGHIDKKKTLRKMVAADVEYLKAFSAARLALRGKGPIREAGSQMARFVEKHRDNYHWYEANRLVGDLLIANRQFAQAVHYFDTLAEAPWFDARLEAAVGKGRALLAEGKVDEAMASFTDALDMKPGRSDLKNPSIDKQKMLAQIGLARCLSEKGQPDKAVVQLRQILDKINPEDTQLAGQAYNALGSALRKAGKPYDALLAFLHVDVLYFASPQEHAEALANLAQLWQEVRKTDRAIQAQEILRSRYPNSQWAKQ